LSLGQGKSPPQATYLYQPQLSIKKQQTHLPLSSSPHQKQTSDTSPPTAGTTPQRRNLKIVRLIKARVGYGKRSGMVWQANVTNFPRAQSVSHHCFIPPTNSTQLARTPSLLDGLLSQRHGTGHRTELKCLHHPPRPAAPPHPPLCRERRVWRFTVGYH
jgi:hypothetical protein